MVPLSWSFSEMLFPVIPLESWVHEERSHDCTIMLFRIILLWIAFLSSWIPRYVRCQQNLWYFMEIEHLVRARVVYWMLPKMRLFIVFIHSNEMKARITALKHITRNIVPSTWVIKLKKKGILHDFGHRIGQWVHSPDRQFFNKASIHLNTSIRLGVSRH